MIDLKQFKLSTREEIICEVLSWPDDDFSEILVRNVIEVYDEYPDNLEFGESTVYYAFKPWLVQQDERGKLQTINPNNVVAVCNPSEEVREQYYMCILRLDLHVEKRKEKLKKRKDDAQELYDKFVNSREASLNDSNQGNVISFPADPNKIH